MNEFGIALAWSAVRVTLVLLPALALHALASRRCPASGSWVASWSLGLVVALSLAAALPRDLGRDVFSASAISVGSTAGFSESKTGTISDRSRRRGDDPAPDPARPGDGRAWSWPIAGLRAAWDRLESGAAAPATRWRRWGSILAYASLIGTGTGLCRLLLGVWAVRLCRRRGRPLDDPALSRPLEEIRVAMGCPRRVEVREVTDLTTPAAAGWIHPVLLLPEDWRTWDEHERRAVLAHELAHVRRGDYATGLVARLALVVHFYHPMVLWLAGRLQLQQELAADALGARFAGGRVRYLHSLSRLALRQDGRSPSWPARAFLPARGTLIRRIAMLRDETKSMDRPWSALRRLLAASLLLAVAVCASTLRGPALGADDDSPADKAKGVTSSPRPDEVGPAFRINGAAMYSHSRVEPFDLSYIPDDVMGFVAFRPATALGRKGMSQFVASLNSGIGLAMKEMGIAQEPEKCPLRIEAIEQVTVGIGIRHVEGKKEYNRVYMTHGLMVRTIEPFDWLKQIHAWWPDLAEVRDAGRVYYKATKGQHGLYPNGCLYVPDSRTVVLVDEERLLRMFRRGMPATPEYTRGEDWELVSRGLLAVAIDNHDGRWTRAFKGSSAEQIGLPSLVEHVDRWIFGYADADDILFRGVGTCADDDSAETTAGAVGTFFETCRRLAGPPGPDAPAGGKAAVHRKILESLTKCRVEREGRTVVLRSDGLGKLADFVSTLVAAEAE